MTDLDAIRARDDLAWGIWQDDPDGMTWDQADRHALLAEVDRLTAEVAYMTFTGAGIPMTGVTARAATDYLDRTIAAAERARIRAAVEGLPTQPGLEVNIPGMRHFIERTAVLAAIDGETT